MPDINLSAAGISNICVNVVLSAPDTTSGTLDMPSAGLTGKCTDAPSVGEVISSDLPSAGVDARGSILSDAIDVPMPSAPDDTSSASVDTPIRCVDMPSVDLPDKATDMSSVGGETFDDLSSGGVEPTAPEVDAKGRGGVSLGVGLATGATAAAGTIIAVELGLSGEVTDKSGVDVGVSIGVRICVFVWICRVSDTNRHTEVWNVL